MIRFAAMNPIAHGLQVNVRRATTPADDVYAELVNEPIQPLGQPGGFEREVGFAVAVLRQPGVRQHANHLLGMPAEVLDRVEHQVRPDAAVHADDVDFVDRFQRDQRGRNVSAGKHLLVGVNDRQLHHERDANPSPFHLFNGRDRHALGFENVEAGLNQNRIDALFDHHPQLQPVRLGHRVEVDVNRRVGDRRHLRARPDGANHKPGARRGRKLGGGLLRNLNVEAVDFFQLCRQTKFAQADLAAVERVRLDRVAPRREEAVVNLLDPLRVCVNQRIRKVQQRLAVRPEAPVRVLRLVLVQARPHAAVENHNPLFGEGQ